MNPGLSNFKEKYNALLKRNNNAEKYLNNCSDAEFEKWLYAFNLITMGLSELIAEYKSLTGLKMSDNEVLNGF